MRLSGVMDADEGVAVAAFVCEGQVERRAAPGGRSRRRRARRRQHGGQRLRQLAPEALRQAVWRVEEDEIVVASLPAAARRNRSASARRTSASPPSASRLACTAAIAAGAESTNVAARGAARERLEPERARPREQVEHPRVLHAIAQDREQRLAHAVGGRARGGAPGRWSGAGRPSGRRRSSLQPQRGGDARVVGGVEAADLLGADDPGLARALIFGRTSTWSIQVSSCVGRAAQVLGEAARLALREGVAEAGLSTAE